MSDASQRLGREAMDFGDLLRETYGEDVQVGDVVIVADILATQNGEIVNHMRFCGSDPRRWVQVALLREALEVAENMNERREQQQLESED